MSDNKKNSSAFLVQGSILAIASIVSRIIGLIYRIPLTNILGNDGNSYYSAAFEIYNILLLISSYSLPLAVSKLVAGRISKNERTNAYRVFKGALIFALITGGIASLVVFFFADVLTTVVLATPESYLALRVLGPTLLIVALMGVIRGFFQGMGTMVPSAFSQIIEQIFNAIVSVVAAYYLYQYGKHVGALLGSSEDRSAEFGAAGGTLGTGAGALAGLIFLVIIFLIFNVRFKKKMRIEKNRKKESYSYIFKVLILTIVPVLLSTTVYNISSFIDQGLYKNIAFYQGYTSAQVNDFWGVFSGKYKVLINLPIAIASALAASAVPSIAGALARGEKDQVLGKLNSSLRFVMLIAFPCAAGMAVLASPILILLYGDAAPLGAMMLQAGAIGIVFYSISTWSNAALQGIDHMSEPVKNATISLVIHVGLLLIMQLVLHMNIYAVIWANTLFAFLMCILNSRSIHKFVRYRQEYRKTFLIPAISAVVMGICVYGVYTLTMNLCNINSVCTLFSIVVGVIVYAVMITRLKGITKQEISAFPMGGRIAGLFEKLHLL